METKKPMTTGKLFQDTQNATGISSILDGAVNSRSILSHHILGIKIFRPRSTSPALHDEPEGDSSLTSPNQRKDSALIEDVRTRLLIMSVQRGFLTDGATRRANWISGQRCLYCNADVWPSRKARRGDSTPVLGYHAVKQASQGSESEIGIDRKQMLAHATVPEHANGCRTSTCLM